jgi:hypothetical protein
VVQAKAGDIADLHFSLSVISSFFKVCSTGYFLILVLSNAYSYIERTAESAVLDRQNLPVKLGGEWQASRQSRTGGTHWSFQGRAV